jgi:hypothetical protein
VVEAVAEAEVEEEEEVVVTEGVLEAEEELHRTN